MRKTILLLPLMAACSAAPKRQVAKVALPPPPTVQREVEAVFTPIGGELQVRQPSDPVALVVLQARKHFEAGEGFYREGFLDRAKREFDRAVDLLLMAHADARIERELEELIARIHAMELAALKEGDGFTDQNVEPAAIDDLRYVETFPAPIDPKEKEKLEEEVRSIEHDIPIVINEQVLGFLDYYRSGRGRAVIETGLQRVGRYRPMIQRVLAEEGVPQDLIFLSQAESAFKPLALSRARAKGMWQFVAPRGKQYGLRQTWWIDERSDPEKSTRAAARHLKDLYAEFGDWYLAMAAYNAGPLRVERAVEMTGYADFWELARRRVLPLETVNYVPTILALTIIGKNPEKYGFFVEPDPPLDTERVRVDKATDLRVIAEAINVPLEQIRELNPHLKRLATPASDPQFELILPKGYAEKFNEQIALLPESKRVVWRHHTVRSGETLSQIARKYGTSATEVAQANNMSVRKLLQVGQTLIIPAGSGPIPVQTAAGGRRQVYTVRRGDTLSEIARKFDVSTEDLLRWNRLNSPRLPAGKKLVVAQPAQPTQPARPLSPTQKVVHRVGPGETLTKIASNYKTSVDAILSWNKQQDLSIIRPGDQITIYVGR